MVHYVYGYLMQLYIVLHSAGDKWKLTSIMWLMVQIWFGETSLSFSEAESFHRILGPILMVTFAALSNTLLITSASYPNWFPLFLGLSVNSSFDGDLVKHIFQDR